MVRIRPGKPDILFECHPVRDPHNPGRFALGKAFKTSPNALVLIRTKAGDGNGASGAITLVAGFAQEVAYGKARNRAGVVCAETVLNMGDSAEVEVTAGGTWPGLHQKYRLLWFGGEMHLSPLEVKQVEKKSDVDDAELFALAQATSGKNTGVVHVRPVA
jgi:hypothetical protein